jgi:TonB family protein
MISLPGLVRPSPQLPARSCTTTLSQTATTLLLHLLAIGAVVVLTIARPPHPRADRGGEMLMPRAELTDQTKHMVFIARATDIRSGGGGGGGNRQAGPIRHAEAIGRDARTVPARRSVTPVGELYAVSSLPGLVLDAKPLAAGTQFQMGLLEGGVSSGTSTGPGSGGGVGDGVGTGIGPGKGPGVGPGSGGGIGGGIYRPGGSVTPPRVVVQVSPKYTDDALLRRIQGTVEMELVVTKDGRPADIRITRSLDPGGLDQLAIAAVERWRFEPGRLAGAPVNVLVTVMLDFLIQ